MAQATATAFDQNGTSVREFPGINTMAGEGEEPELTIWQKYLLALHITTMAKPTTPYWNPAMVGTWCTVIALVVVLVSLIAGGAFYLGIQHQKYEDVQRRLLKAEEDAATAKTLEATRAGGAGHEEENK